MVFSPFLSISFERTKVRSAEIESWQRDKESFVSQVSQLNLCVENLETTLTEIAHSSHKDPTTEQLHDCKDCKYLRRVIAKEGRIKELEISGLRHDIQFLEEKHQSAPKAKVNSKPLILASQDAVCN